MTKSLAVNIYTVAHLDDGVMLETKAFTTLSNVIKYFEEYIKTSAKDLSEVTEWTQSIYEFRRNIAHSFRMDGKPFIYKRGFDVFRIDKQIINIGVHLK